eukprot:5777500-Prymnesium_polylepis.1
MLAASEDLRESAAYNATRQYFPRQNNASPPPFLSGGLALASQVHKRAVHANQSAPTLRNAHRERAWPRDQGGVKQ